MVCLSILFMITSINCNNIKEKDRDIISFREPTSVVEKNLLTMNNFMDKTLFVPGKKKNYFFDFEGSFYLNSEKLGRIEDLTNNKDYMLTNLTTKEKEKFIETVKFLKNNYLSHVFLDATCKCYLYGYHETEDPSFKSDRLIYIDEKHMHYSTLLVQRKILDKKGNVVLIGSN